MDLENGMNDTKDMNIVYFSGRGEALTKEKAKEIFKKIVRARRPMSEAHELNVILFTS